MDSPSPPTERPALRVALEGLGAGERALEGDAAHYVTRVHRLAAGDQFVAFDPSAGLEADATLLSVGRREVRVRLGPPRAAGLLGMPGVTLIVCATKGDKLDDVIRAATALGASTVSIVESSRSVPELGRGAVRRFGRFQSIAVDAARQSGRGDLPAILGPLPLAAVLGQSADSGALCLLLEPSAEQPLGAALAERGERPVTLLVGPEGGLTEDERGLAERSGFRAVRLGRLVLRAELAAVAALSAVVAQSSTQNPEMQ